MIKIIFLCIFLYSIVSYSRRAKRKRTFFTAYKSNYGPLSCSPEFNGYSEIAPYLYEIYLDDKLVHNWIYANDLTGMVIVQDGSMMRHAFGSVKYKYIGDKVVN